MAQRSNTIYLPSFTKETKKFFKSCQQMIQKKSNLFTGLFVLNIVVAVFAAHLEQEASYRLNEEK